MNLRNLGFDPWFEKHKSDLPQAGHGIARKTFLGDGNTVGRVVELALQEDEADGGGRVILDFSFHDKDLASMSVFKKEGLRAVKDPQLRGFRRS